jgi:hypothetical protein
MVGIIGGGGLSPSSLFSMPSWQSSSADVSQGFSSADVSSGLPGGMPDWSSTTAAQDLSDFFSDAVAGISSTFSSATTNELNGLVNNAADAAAKRLGIKLPSSSSSSSSSSSPTSKTSTSSSSSSGQSLASKNIDGLLATLDGNAPAASTSSGTVPKFNLSTFLTGLDQITSGTATSNVPATPSGKNFSIDSYLATLDQITRRPPPAVNVTA